MTDIKKSLNQITNERISSPLYGTLILSWLIWNWKIIYITFFVSEDKIEKNKIDYIITNYSDLDDLVFFPLLSTLVLLTLMPFVSNGAYWLSLKFNIWKSDKKNEVERKQLLTLEQSIQLRELIADQEKRFENILADKNTEIKQLKIQIEESEKNIVISNPPFKTKSDDNIENVQNLVDSITKNNNLSNAFEIINFHIQGGYIGLIKANGISTDIMSYFESNDIIVNKGKGMYELTDIGKKVNKGISSSKFE
jgi:hypothetical protein